MLPFSNPRIDANEVNTDTNDPITIQEVEGQLKHLQGTTTHTTIAHLNTQCLTSTFTEFEAFINQYQFDIMTLSET